MKRKTKVFATLTLSALSVLALGAACGESAAAQGPLGEAYEFIFDKPYAAVPDEYINVDGYLDDAIWENKNWIEQTASGAAWAATTHFTEKGLYIAVEATDATMSYKTRYSARSNFNVYVCKTGTQAINLNSLAYYPSECQCFILDPYYCRAKNRIPYNYEAKFTGELNSETECTMTAELFLAWEDLFYTEAELGENGYPESIQMYVNYEGEQKEVLGSCLWRQETYFHYNENGLIGTIDHQDFGNAKDGLAATDQWIINEQGNLQTTAGRTQIAWLKEANSKSFMFEAQLKPLGTRVNANGQTETISLRGDRVVGRFGLITARNPWADSVTTVSGYSIYSADARSICDQKAGNKSIKVQTYRQTDSFHWSNLIGLSQQTVETGYLDDTVTLRIIKDGDNYYYFYNDSYWKSERNSNLQEEVYCGIYTSQGVELIDYKFVDYTGKADELQNELRNYVYFIETAGEMTRGGVIADTYAVAKGKEVTITFSPKMQSVLTDITMGANKESAVSVFDEVYAQFNANNEYTFTPTGDTYIGGEYTSFPKNSIVRTLMNFTDETGAKVMDAQFEVRGNDLRMYYKGTPNASGYVIANLPKKGTYEIDGKSFEVTGEYTLKVKFNQHHTYETTFTIDENTVLDEKGQYILDVTVQSNGWGTVKVNTKTVTGSGTLLYNEETGNYYTSGGVRRYFKDTVATDYVANVKLQMTEVGNRNSDLMALAITDGNDVLVIKYNLENSGKVIIATGNETANTTAGQEYAITGFKYDKVQEPYGAGKNGYGTVSIKVVKCGSAIYLFNSQNQLKAYFNKNGVHLVNGCAVSWGASAKNVEEINKDVAALFAGGEKTQTALGLFTYNANSIRAEIEYDFSRDLTSVYEAIGYGDLSVNLPEGRTLNTEDYPVRAGYALGEIVTIGVNVANAKNLKMQMLITSKDGIKIVDGTYDWATGCIVFEFEYAGGDVSVSTAIIKDGGMSWSDEWGEFIPDRENTMP